MHQTKKISAKLVQIHELSKYKTTRLKRCLDMNPISLGSYIFQHERSGPFKLQ